MSALDAVLSQASAVSTLRRAHELGRIASAYLFEGPSGVGKELAATALATDVVGKGDPQAIHRIQAGAHPDVRIFRPREDGKRNIQVDVLRHEILPLAQFAPFETEATFFIFPEADVSFPPHQPEAANAILKTLEEPRPNVHFILTSERPDSLLPTIRSRCQRLRFGPLPSVTLKRLLESHDVPDASIAAAVALSGGRADLAVALGSDGTVEELTDMVLSLDHAIDVGGPGTLVGWAETLSRADDLELSLLALQNLYRDLAVLSLDAEASDLAFETRSTELAARAERLGAHQAAARASRIHECVDSMRRNANKQVALDALLFSLREIR